MTKYKGRKKSCGTRTGMTGKKVISVNWDHLPVLNLYGSPDPSVVIPDPGPCEDEVPVCIHRKLSISDEYPEGIVNLADLLGNGSCIRALLKD